MSKILIADDDVDIVELISESLEDEGFECIKINDSRKIYSVVNEQADIELIILDIMMPYLNGIEVCREIRLLTEAPIIFLTAKSRDIDKIVGLEIGADDYMVKPFSTDELVARVKAHIRREKRKVKRENELIEQQKESKDLINPWRLFGEYQLNPLTFEVIKEAEKIDLSTKEFQLLNFLYENENLVLTRQQIYEGVWGYSDFGDISTVTVHIKNLRTKLTDEGKHIITVWGVGYKFVK